MFCDHIQPNKHPHPLTYSPSPLFYFCTDWINGLTRKELTLFPLIAGMCPIIRKILELLSLEMWWWGFGVIHRTGQHFTAESVLRITRCLWHFKTGFIDMSLRWSEKYPLRTWLLDTHLTIVLRNHGLLMTEGTASSMSGCVLMKFSVSSGNSLEVVYFSKEGEPAQQPGLKGDKKRGVISCLMAHSLNELLL